MRRTGCAIDPADDSRRRAARDATPRRGLTLHVRTLPARRAQKTVESLGGLDAEVEMVPVPRPWEEPGLVPPRFWRTARGWFGL